MADWVRDTVERVVSTVAQVVISAAATAATLTITTADEVTLGTTWAAVQVGYAAGLAALKAWLARVVDGAVSPASLARAKQTG